MPMQGQSAVCHMHVLITRPPAIHTAPVTFGVLMLTTDTMPVAWYVYSLTDGVD